VHLFGFINRNYSLLTKHGGSLVMYILLMSFIAILHTENETLIIHAFIMTSVAFLGAVAGLASSPNLGHDYFSVFRCLSFAMILLCT